MFPMALASAPRLRYTPMMIPFWLVSPYDDTIVVMQGTLGGERGMKLFVERIVEFHQVSNKVSLIYIL